MAGAAFVGGGPCLAVRTKGLELVGMGGIGGAGLYGRLMSSTCMVQFIVLSAPLFGCGGGGFLVGGICSAGTLTVPKLGTGGGPFVFPAHGGGLGAWNRDTPVAEPADGSG